MKFLIVLCAVAACVLAIPSENQEDFKSKFQEIRQACMAESGTTEEVAKNVNLGDFIVHDEPAQCFVDCIFKRLGFKSDKGEILPNAIIANVKKWANVKTGSFEELINRCVQEKGEGKCETAFKIYECYRPNLERKTLN